MFDILIFMLLIKSWKGFLYPCVNEMQCKWFTLWQCEETYRNFLPRSSTLFLYPKIVILMNTQLCVEEVITAPGLART